MKLEGTILKLSDGLVCGRSVGEMLCFNLLAQFLRYRNETCYTWSIGRESIHNMFCKGFEQRFLKLCPFFGNS